MFVVLEALSFFPTGVFGKLGRSVGRSVGRPAATVSLKMHLKGGDFQHAKTLLDNYIWVAGYIRDKSSELAIS